MIDEDANKADKITTIESKSDTLKMGKVKFGLRLSNLHNETSTPGKVTDSGQIYFRKTDTFTV